MNYRVFDAITLLNEAENIEDLCRIFERVMCHYGFDLFALQFSPKDMDDKKPVIYATYDPKWVNHYHEQAYHLIDPVIRTGSKSKHPFLWSDSWKGLELTKQQRVFFNEAKDFGVGVGVGIPVLSPYYNDGMVSLVSSCVDVEDMARTVMSKDLEIQLLCNHFQLKAHYFFSQQSISGPAIHLTERERECLKWASSGKTDREIGMILNISHRTVNHHMSNAMHRLDAYSREYAIVKAIMHKVIEL